MSIISRASAPISENAIVMGKVEDRDIYNTSYVGYPPTPLPVADKDYEHERYLAKNCRDGYGIKPMTPEELSAERALSWAIIKRLTMAVLSMDFTHFSFPVGYSEPRSFLERTADIFTFIADDYANQMVNCKDPVKRIQLLTTGVVAGYHIYMQSKKPWNPILGETYIGRWPNGVTIYGEQTSHHPPISDFQIESPDKSWKCHAHCNFTISSGVMNVDILQTGIFHLEFTDGGKYEWQFPVITVSGVIRGERYVNVKGQMVVRDTVNNLTSTVVVQPRTGFFSWAGPTVIDGKVTDENGKLLSQMTGDYAESLKIGDEEIWNIEKVKASRPIAEVRDDELLLSDSRFRLDRMYLIKKEMDIADGAKVTLEEAQRREEKLRICVPKEEEQQQQ
ncbi:Oxysterol binding protein [Histomonas meleagridis]|uniref:Oxysterol binding protein n=1 Tax=Histomonas meleagridis TaxID=135588 RepID=UPI00355AA7CA|nr:Oxysterol binding protein [Histomonas meleagridis]KAH0804802.1 Oxysterol binding protein [Histomonas meleagridis]